MIEKPWDYNLGLSQDKFISWMPGNHHLVEDFTIIGKYTYFVRYFLYIHNGTLDLDKTKNITDESLLNYI